MIHGSSQEDAESSIQQFYLQADPFYSFHSLSIPGVDGESLNPQSVNSEPVFYEDFNSVNVNASASSDCTDLQSIPSMDLLQLDGSEMSNFDASFLTNSQSSLINAALKLEIHPQHLNSNFTEKAAGKNTPPFIRRESDTFPNLEEHDHANARFELDLNPSAGNKNSWNYSAKLQKVFINLDKTFHIEASHAANSSIQNQKLFLRCMMVFVDEISEPVVRCANHMCSDRETDELIKFNVIRSANPDAIYAGKHDGKTIPERLSVLIPLNQLMSADENSPIKHSIALKFVCQNSCIGRKQTAIIFTLENEKFEVLSKKVVNVKVCSCPKRDKEKEEDKFRGLKRPASDNIDCPAGKRAALMNTKIKEEPGFESSSPESNSDLEVTVTLTMPSISAMRHVVNVAFDHIAGLMALETDSKRYLKHFRLIKKTLAQLDGREQK